MKKVLFATTALVLSAGFAAAGEIKFSGSAAAGVASDEGGAYESYSSAGLSVAYSGTTDGGLTFGANFSMTTGQSYTFGTSSSGFASESGAFGMPEVYISGGFGRLSVKHNGYNYYHNDSSTDDADIQYTYSNGGLSVGVRYNVEAQVGSVQLGYAMDAISVTANIDQGNAWDISASYAMGAFTVSAGTDDGSASWIKGAYSANGMSASLKLHSDSTWDASAGYSANGMSVDVSTNEASEWSATAAYDLGGGASVVAGANYSNDAYLGMSFSF